jgi:hypothetical protein
MAEPLFDPTTFLEDPNARAALLNFGINLAQPTPVGQTGLGHFGQALAGAGAGVRQLAADEARDTEAASRQDLRLAQANSAEDRARTAGDIASMRGTQAEQRAALAAAGLDLKRAAGERADAALQQRNEQQTLSALLRAQSGYSAYQKAQQKLNADNALLNPKAPQAPIMDFQSWAKQNPALASRLPQADAPAVAEAAPAATDGLETVPPAPRDPAQRVEGRSYQAANGSIVRWVGGKWVQ